MSWFWTILSATVSFAIFVWASFRIYYRRILQQCRAIPNCPGCYPLIGHLHVLSYSLDKTIDKVRQIIEEAVLQEQSVTCAWLGPYPIIVVAHPEHIKKVLHSSMSRGKEMEEGSREYMKYGLLTSPVDHWKLTRRHLNLAFNPRNLEQLIPTFNWTSKELVSDLSGLTNGTEFNMMPHVMSAALRSICIFLYGPEMKEHVSGKPFDSLKQAVEMIGELMALRSPRPWYKSEMLFKLFYGKEINEVKSALCRIFEVAETVKARSRNTEKEVSNADLSKTTSSLNTILDAMQKLQEKYPSVTDQHILDEMSSFFVAGTDTIGSTVSSCLLALARYPEVQEKVYEEIRSVVAHGEEITFTELNRLTYLDQVIKETLRFFLVVPFTPRVLKTDIQLDGYTLPAEKTIFLFLAGVSMDLKYFPDPYEFDPDRFSTFDSPEESFFMPFSSGPRNCIGKLYAMALSKVMVAHVVQNFRLSTKMDIANFKIKFMMTITCREGYNVFLSKRSD